MNPWLRGLLTAAIFGGLGPPFGLVCVITIVVTSAPPAEGEAASFGLFDGGLGLLLSAGPLLAFLVLLILGSYVVGGIPALLTGAIASVARPWLRSGFAWVLVSTAIGAGACWAGSALLASAQGPTDFPAWALPATGAFAAFLCSVISLRIVPKGP